MYDAQRYDIAFLWQAQRRRRSGGIDVVYDHRDQDVTLISADDVDTSERALEALGWTRRAADGQRSFWIRDRHATTRAALELVDQAAPHSGQVRPWRQALQLERGPELSL